MKAGSLFSGYGGLDMAVNAVLGTTTAWHCEIDPAASRILAHHHPDIPNHGDITKVDWDQVEPVDVLTGGFHCQDLSAAGKRAGLRPGTRSGLWLHMAYAISQLRPQLVIIENVRGILSAEAHSDVESCAWCVGDGEGEPPLRALGAVLGDLAALGYDARPVWGEYEPAIRRWEHILGRPAPEPTEPGTRGNRRLSPRFVEWMMGLPSGWVTDVPGITRNDQLKALGNGVVPAQAALALRHLVPAMEVAA